MAQAADRLSAFDLTSLAVEAADTPMHVAVVAVLDGRTLLDDAGDPRMSEIQDRLRDGVAAAPRLRQMIRRRPLGRARWSGDPAFRIERHVSAVVLEPPGGEAELLRAAERLLAAPLPRTRPLWRLWVVTGLPDRRLALIVALHHAIGDGVAVMRLIDALLDPARRDWDPVSGRDRPARSLAAVWRTIRQVRGAPRTTLNAPVGPGRRLGVTHLDLAAAKAVAHAAGGKVNDVVVSVAAGGLRALLAARGERTDGVELRVAVAASLRGPDERGNAGNHNGSFLVPVPLQGTDAEHRLRAIAAATARAKREQAPVAQQHCMVLAARTGLARRISRHQHMVNLAESNLPGPPAPIHALGAPVLHLLPVGAIAGNMTVSFLALSYAGDLVITAIADRARVPDLPVLLDGMRREWRRLHPAGHPPAGLQHAKERGS
ncbi:wax ester/triacylglycerol synthase domain-containing protein [Dactylosporangium sp. NPDC051541]|uniref:wax ester/triacylglycerol synthase domain-containing protein n=1 Tax=Dactylosporangium sp. NPDC051541 TaxID=3363977 RepID=UPI003787E2FC